MSLDIQGENSVFSPHADSGAMVVAEGMKCLVDRRAQGVLCAGVSEKVTPFSLARAHLCGILNETHPQDGQMCKPFDRERRGTVLGEGCGAIALELESSARKRGIPTVVSITGMVRDARRRRMFGPHIQSFPSGHAGWAGPRRCEAFRDRSRDRPWGRDGGRDRHEAEAIHDVFSSCIDRMVVYSSKGAIGHLQAGGPLVDVILGVSMLRSGLVPPIQGTSSPEPDLRFRLVIGEPVRKPLRKILISCQSYEGQAASLILETIDQHEGR